MRTPVARCRFGSIKRIPRALEYAQRLDLDPHQQHGARRTRLQVDVTVLLCSFVRIGQTAALLQSEGSFRRVVDNAWHAGHAC